MKCNTVLCLCFQQTLYCVALHSRTGPAIGVIPNNELFINKLVCTEKGHLHLEERKAYKKDGELVRGVYGVGDIINESGNATKALIDGKTVGGLILSSLELLPHQDS